MLSTVLNALVLLGIMVHTKSYLYRALNRSCIQFRPHQSDARLGRSNTLDSQAAIGPFDPDIPLLSPVPSGGTLLVVGPDAHPHLLAAVQGRMVPVLDLPDAFPAAQLPPEGGEHEDQRQGPLDEQSAVVALDVAGVLRVQVDAVGVVGQGGEVEQQRLAGEQLQRRRRCIWCCNIPVV